MAFLCIIFLFLISSIQTVSGDDTLTVYEVLQEYDFPVGLLPKGVTSYELENSTGAFTIYFNSTCSFSIDSYEFQYKTNVTGYITTDKISSLSGIKVKVLLSWFEIDEVSRDGDYLELSSGIASAEVAVSNFDESATCGCGFDCDDANVRKGLVSSS